MPTPTLTLVDIKDDVITLEGGLDQKTPTLSLHPKFARDASNFECSVSGGYARVGGYEAYDGRAKPSDQTYGLVQVTSFVNTPSVGQTLTGFDSGATGTIIAIGSNYLVLTQLTGAYDDGEIVSVGMTMIGTTTALLVSRTAKQNAQYANLAADVYRALIQPVPGSGPVRGVVSAVFGGVHKVYAFRDNVGGTACLMYVASSSGWTQLTFDKEISFTAGGASIPADGDTLTQGGNTAVIKRVVLETGTWGSSTAAGRLIIGTPTPGSFSAGAATIGAVGVTLSGVQTDVTFLPNGKFEFDINNFSGQLSTRKIYGAYGVGRCFEFDGTVMVPIKTGATVDTPKHIKVHHFHLFVSIGSSYMHSGLGTPYQFTALAGGGEATVGDTITGFLVQPGNNDTATMAIFSQTGSGMLYGTSVSNFKYIAYKTEVGCLPYMAQNLDSSYMFDDQGLVSLATAQEFGNFQQATLTRNLQTFIAEKQAFASCSCVNKEKGQYRAFFTDGSYLYATLVNGEFKGALPGLFPDPINCVWTGELSNGNVVTYAGSLNDGYVFELDRGSSFNGESIDATITLNWNFQKTPRIEKKYHGASVEIQSENYAAISFGYLLGYNSDLIPQPSAKEYESNLGGVGYWDEFSWDAFFWDGRTLSPTEVTLNGRAENIQITFTSETDYIYPYILNSLIIFYSLGRRVRR